MTHGFVLISAAKFAKAHSVSVDRCACSSGWRVPVSIQLTPKGCSSGMSSALSSQDGGGLEAELPVPSHHPPVAHKSLVSSQRALA